MIPTDQTAIKIYSSFVLIGSNGVKANGDHLFNLLTNKIDSCLELMIIRYIQAEYRELKESNIEQTPSTNEVF